MIDILTGTAFDSRERLNHREDEVAAEFPSSASSRARGLLALKAQNWRARVSPTPGFVTEGLTNYWDYRRGWDSSGWTDSVGGLTLVPTSVTMGTDGVVFNGNSGEQMACSAPEATDSIYSGAFTIELFHTPALRGRNAGVFSFGASNRHLWVWGFDSYNSGEPVSVYAGCRYRGNSGYDQIGAVNVHHDYERLNVLTVVCNGNSARFLVDGVEIKNATGAGGARNGSDFRLGRIGTYSSMTGTVKAMRWYSRALTDAEVAQDVAAFFAS